MLQAMKNSSNSQSSPRMRKFRKWLFVACIGLAAVVILVILLLSFSFTRNRVLDFALERVKRSLPGEFVVREAMWTSIGSIEAAGVTWVEGADTLLSLDELQLSIGVKSLFKRNLNVQQVRLAGVSVNVPAIRNKFPGSDTKPSGGEKSGMQLPFIREGSITGVPSVRVGRFELTASSLQLDTENEITSIEIKAGITITRNEAPAVVLERCSVSGFGGRYGIDSLSLHIDLGRGVASGTGSGFLEYDRTFHVDLSSASRDSVILALSLDGFGSRDAGPGLTIGARLEREGFRLRSFAFKGMVTVPSTGELRSTASMSSWMEKVPDLGKTIIALDGFVGLAPSVTANIRCDFRGAGWLHDGTLRAAYRPDALAVDSLSFALPGLSFSAGAALVADSVSGRIGCSVTGGEWLDILNPGSNPPEELKAELNLAFAGDMKRELRANLKASGVMDGISLQRLELDAGIPADSVNPVRFNLRLRAQEVGAALQGEINRGKQIQMRLTPLRISLEKGPAGKAGTQSSFGGRIAYVPSRKTLEVGNLQIIGDLGNLRINGRLDEGQRGFYKVSWSLRQTPGILLQRLRAKRENLDTLRTRWAEEGPFTADVDGKYIDDGKSKIIETSARFKLPGPGVFSSVLPAMIKTNDMGPLAGSLELQSTSAGGGSIVHCIMNLDSTEWIDSSAAHVRLQDGRIHIDTLGVACEGLFIGASGAYENNTWNVNGGFQLTGQRLLERVNSPALQEASVDLNGRMRLVKDPQMMDLEANAAGSFKSRTLSLGGLALDARLDRSGMQGRLRISDGLSLSAVQIDSLVAAYQSTGAEAEIFPGRFSLHAHGADLEVFKKLWIDVSPDISVRVDTLAVGLQSRYFRSAHPFAIELTADRDTFTVDDLELAGEMGSIRANIFASADSTNMTAAADVIFPDMPSSLALPPDVWPNRLNAQIRAAGKNQLSANVDISGITLGDGRRPVLSLRAEGSADSLVANLSVADSVSSILKGYASLPASISLWPVALQLSDDPVHLEADIHQFPVGAYLISETSRKLPSRMVRLNGKVVVRGSASSPSAFLSSEVSFPEWGSLANYKLIGEALAAPDGGLDSALVIQLGDSMERSGPRTAAFDTAGLSGTVNLRRNEQAVLTGTIHYPAVISLRPFFAQIGGDERIECRVSSQQIQLEDFTPLFPPDVELAGLCKLDFSATEDVHDPKLSGFLNVKDLRVTHSDDMNIFAQSNIRIEGSAKRPVIRGDIEIQSGVIKVPEPPKTLHPVDGAAVLWQAANEAKTADSAGVHVPLENKSGDARPSPQLDLDVGVSIPSGLWLRGQGLEVELSGKLRIIQKESLPTITGSLRAMRGQLVFSGRVFELDRGEVVFYGEDEINPSLNVELTAMVDQTRIRIMVRGTVQELDLQFASEPEMTEGDILSLLLLGRKLDELNDDQFDLLQRRATDLLSAFGTTKLEGRLSRQLGVDMVRIRSGRDGQNGRALVIGKYLSRRLLVKYEQLLEEANFLINLEYLLTRQLKLETLYGRRDQSGIELDWTKEY